MLARTGLTSARVLFALLAAVPCSTAYAGADPAKDTACEVAGTTPALAVDFESGSLDALPSGVRPNPPKPEAIGVVDSAHRNGKYAARVTVDDSPSFIFPDGSGRIRAEFTTLDTAETAFSEGDRRSYRLSFMLAPNWQFDSRESIDIVWQWKRTGGPPDMFLAVKGSDLVLRIGSTAQLTLIPSLRAGTWVDLCVKVDWSTSSVGRVESSHRYEGHEEYSASPTFSGATLGTRTGKTYLKWGIYKPDNYQRSTSRGPHVVYFDDIAIYDR